MQSTDNEKRIGGFRIVKQIKDASGSQGVVYKAICETAVDGIAAVGDLVALKVMIVQDEDRSQWRRLERRTQELVQLNHPNVVRYLGCLNIPSAFNDTHIVVQEFLDGETLKDRLLRHPSGLDVEEGLKIVKAAVDGLIYTSERGIVHRDLKPGNIFLCLNDKGAIKGVKLIDFEIAKQEGGTTTTAAGNLRGTFDYMAPDFMDPNFHGDVQSDIFSMGVVLYEVITGKTPYQRFDGDNRHANFAFLSRWSASSSDGATPIHVSSRVNRLLANARDVLVNALARDRARRYESFAAFRSALGGIALRELRNGSNAYRLEQFVGKGGFGEVYKARHVQTGEMVAIKRLLRPEYAERFKREARVLQKLAEGKSQGDCLFVRLVDFFERTVASGATEAFLVMEYLPGMPGSSLRDAIRSAAQERKHLPFNDVVRAFVRYARGLQQMHTYGDKGIVHRDIKPSNLYFPPGHPERAAIMDFGIVKDLGGTVTTTGQVPGTLDYMPPEVVIEEGNRGDAGMDVFALGLCLYEALTGKTGYPRLPIGAPGYTAFFARAQSRTPPVFDDPLMEKHPDLLRLLTSMVMPDSDRRLKDASIVADRLERLILFATNPALGEVEPATSATQVVSPSDFQAAAARKRDARSRTLTVWAAVSALVAVLLGSLWLYAQRFGRLGGRVKTVPAFSNGSSGPTNNVDSTKGTVPDLGYVEFRWGADEECRFNGNKVRKDDTRRPQAVGDYECEFSRTNKEYGVMRYRLQRIRFAVSNKAVTVVSPSADWKESLEFVNARHAAKIEEAMASKQSEVDKEQKKLASLRAEAEKAKGELDRAKAEAAKALSEKNKAIADREKALKDASDAAEKARKARVTAENEVAKAASDLAEKEKAAKTAEAAAQSARKLREDADKEAAAILAKAQKDANDRIRLAELQAEQKKAVDEEKEKERQRKAADEARAAAEAKKRAAEAAKRKADEENAQKVAAAEAAQREKDAAILKLQADEKRLQDAERAVREKNELLASKEGEMDKKAKQLAADEEEIKRQMEDLKKEKERLRKAAEEEAKRKAEEEAKRKVEEETKRKAEEAAKRKAEETAKRKAEEKIRQEKERQAKKNAVTNDFWRLLGELTPVVERRKRLEQASGLLDKYATEGILDYAEARQLNKELIARQRWIVGVVSNGCTGALDVSGKSIRPGGSAVFVFEDGLLPGRWEATRKGYDAKRLDAVFDGRELVLLDADFQLSKVEIRIPKLPDGVLCRIDGELVSGSLMRRPGETFAYSYERRGYDYTGKTEYAVTGAGGQSLPAPSDGDWKIRPVKVYVPQMMEGISCFVDGEKVSGGKEFVPGRKLKYVFKRKGYEDIEKQYEVQMADYQDLPTPRPEEWKSLNVTVELSPLSADVSRIIDGIVVTGTTCELSPGIHTCKYVRDDFKPQEVKITVAASSPVETPDPVEWEKTEGLTSLDAAEAAAKGGDWEKVGALLKVANVESAANMARKQNLEEKFRSYNESSELINDAEMAWESEDYYLFIQKYAEAKSKGMTFTKEQLERIEDAYKKYEEDNKLKRENAIKRINSNFNEQKLLDQLRQVQEWYKSIKR